MYWTFFFVHSSLFCTDCGAKRAIWYQLLTMCVNCREFSILEASPMSKRIEHSVNILNEVWNFFKSNVRANRERAYLNSEFGKFCKNFSIFENFLIPISKKIFRKKLLFFSIFENRKYRSKNFFRIDYTISRLSTAFGRLRVDSKSKWFDTHR